jgi:isochorismate synthase EntC
MHLKKSTRLSEHLLTSAKNQIEHNYYFNFITQVFLKKASRARYLPSRRAMVQRLRQLQRRPFLGLGLDLAA